jgi:hypothetical protein
VRKKAAIGLVIGIAVLLWVRVSDGQVFPTPTPGTGSVTVSGKVDVGNVVPVDAAQRGDWRVAVANAPDVRVTNVPTVALAPLPFLKVGGRFVVGWPAGEPETVRVVQLASGGWVRVESSGRRRWINLDAARFVDETD